MHVENWGSSLAKASFGGWDERILLVSAGGSEVSGPLKCSRLHENIEKTGTAEGYGEDQLAASNLSRLTGWVRRLVLESGEGTGESHVPGE